MRSAIFEGLLRHRRFMPRMHRFSYRIFMMYLDLDELDELLSLTPLWSKRSWRPAQFRRSDFLGDPAVPLKRAVCDRIFEETGARHEGRVCVLANLRYYGFIINPITCYYCFDSLDQLQYIVVEVTNTPWKERKSYVLPCDPELKFQRIDFDKQMHVSPFNPINMKYRWCSNQPGKMLTLNLETMQDNDVHVDATMALKRQDIDAAALNGALLRHPWMTAKVVLAIYWQALKLWIKRNPIYDHPESAPAVSDEPTVDRINTNI